MKNSEKYKTSEERGKAFNKFCENSRGCLNCVLGKIKMNPKDGKARLCVLKWLEMETFLPSQQMIKKLIDEAAGKKHRSRFDAISRVLTCKYQIQKIWEEQAKERNEEYEKEESCK